MQAVLEIQNLYHQFGKTPIISDVSLTVNAGERIAVIGPNGAGKSTLFHLISGKMQPTAGNILFRGQSIVGKKPYAIQRMGLSRSFQISQLFPQLSVFDNIRCSVFGGFGIRYNFWRFLDSLHDVNRRTDEIMHMLHLEKRHHILAANLSYAEQRALEIGITIGSGADTILLDEPTAGMSQSETLRFLDLIRTITHHKTLLMVEHDMNVVFGLADKIAVLGYGELITFDTPDAIRANPRVQAAYLGQYVEDKLP